MRRTWTLQFTRFIKVIYNTTYIYINLDTKNKDEQVEDCGVFPLVIGLDNIDAIYGLSPFLASSFILKHFNASNLSNLELGILYVLQMYLMGLNLCLM